jgi:hypothetical protein
VLFLKIFRYLDTIVIKHINKILDLAGLHGKNKYNCFVLFCFVLFCGHVHFFVDVSALAKLSTQLRWCYIIM